MFIFTCIVLGLASLLLIVSGVCWAVFIVADSAAWRGLAVKMFRLSMVCVLFYVNAAVYVHVVSAIRGEPAAAPAVSTDE